VGPEEAFHQSGANGVIGQIHSSSFAISTFSALRVNVTGTQLPAGASLPANIEC
jgi:hypothetical protein